MNSIGFLETFWQDLRYGARSLRLNLGFAAIAIASLTIGIGANTTIFQLLDAIRLRSLPVNNPQQLAMVHIANRHWGAGSFSGSYPQLTNPSVGATSRSSTGLLRHRGLERYGIQSRAGWRSAFCPGRFG